MVAALLDAGHSSAAVMDQYSLDEIEAHYHAHLRWRAKTRLELITDLTVAGGVKKAVRQRHIRMLQGVPQRLHKARLQQTRGKMECLFDDLGAVGTRTDNEDGDDHADDQRIPDEHRNRQGLGGRVRPKGRGRKGPGSR